MSGGPLKHKVYAAVLKTVPPLEVVDAVSRGTAQKWVTVQRY